MGGGGAERVTSALANYWVTMGWRVTVLTIASENSDFYMLDSRIQRISLNMDANSSSFVSALQNNIRRLRALRSVLKSVQPNVALGMMSTSNVLLALASRGLPIRSIGSERIHPPTLPLGRVWEILRRWSYRGLYAVVAQTRVSADWVSRHTRARHVEAIPNPVIYPLEQHEPEVSPEVVRDRMACQRLLLAVGRLEPQKGFDRLLDAFMHAAMTRGEWGLVVLGEGGQRSELEDQVRRLGLENRVSFPGVVGNVAKWYEMADLYVLSSRFEGFPNTLVEAMAHGLPVIAIDCETGPRDIVRDGHDGVLVPGEYPERLREALETLMDSESERENLGRNASAIRERFSLASVARRWEELFPQA